MRRATRLAWVAGAAALALAGAGVSAALMDIPVDAKPLPIPQDPPPAQTPPAQTPPTEAAPAGDPAPASPVPVTPPGGAESIAAAVAAAQQEDRAPAEPAATEDEADAEDADEEVAAAETAKQPTEAEAPARRQRRRYAIVQAVDKVTAETMRFEVEVNGRPVAFNKTLIFRARACEVTAPEERERDAVAYLEVSIQSRGAPTQDVRQVFRGWMFASSPGLSGLQHPVYDAWVVGCRA